MTVRVVRLGTPRAADKGLRIGTVRRPPRGVPKAEFSSGNWYDVWFPTLAPSDDTFKLGRAAADDPADQAAWSRFSRAYKAEMKQAPAQHALDLLAALSHSSALSVGCYCADESHCHRSILRTLLRERGASLADSA